MTVAPLSLREDYWETFEVQENDIEYLYNQLMEIEKPLTSESLLELLILERIKSEKEKAKKQIQGDTKVYLPKNHHEAGEELVFPILNWEKGKILNIRDGFNPEVEGLKVIEVQMDSGDIKEFASEIEDHALNNPVVANDNDPLLNKTNVLEQFGEDFGTKINKSFAGNEDLVCIADHWFPKALLVDVNQGYLNLAEALLDMENGGPLNTPSILSQIDLPTDVSADLTEFSLNFALQEDERFDEVGASGEVLWYLRRLEPENVQNKPVYLQHEAGNYEFNEVLDQLKMLDVQIIDELEEEFKPSSLEDEVKITLIYPHFVTGALPLSNQNLHIFPTALESPRVRFTFVDEDTQEKFSGWVVRPYNYVIGLKDWFDKHGVLPGSTISVRRGKNRGEVIISSGKRRPTKEWVRTALVGADKKIVFAMLKQQIGSNYDERMVIFLPDSNAIKTLWIENKVKNLEKTTQYFMNELVKINSQGNVHFQELYAAVNLTHRCPPSEILNLLMNCDWAVHLGDLYFKLKSKVKEEDAE